MRKIKVRVEMGLVGCKREERIVEVEDDSTEQEIEDAARETLFSMISWSWEEVQ